MKRVFISILALSISLSAFCGLPFFSNGIEFSDVDMVSFQEDEFVLGEENQSYTVKTVIKPFKINRYEVTYKLWYEVRIWAEKNGYAFQNPGQEGSNGLRGRTPTISNNNEPVTNVNWYDVIIWLNAFSEKEGKTPCYTLNGEVLRDSSDTASCDLAICNFNADGYRLPTEAEWEYAARKTVAGFQSGFLASGQVDLDGNDDESIATEEVAWTFENSKGTKKVGTAGTPFKLSELPKSGSGNPNGSGLFDMSGNVLEWCNDWYDEYPSSSSEEFFTGAKLGSERVMRGGSWNEYTLYYAAGDRYSYDPNEFYNYFGFRFVCSE